MNFLLRSVTAVVLLAAIAWLLFFADRDTFSVACIIVSTAIAFEWAVVSGLSSVVQRCLFTVAELAVLLMAYLNADVFHWLLIFVLPAVVLLWCMLIVVVVSYRTGRYAQLLGHTGVKLLFGGLVITAFWFALVQLHQEHFWLLVLLLVACIVFDSCAYLVGRWKGKNKLCPDISPGKTWEGLIGGVVLTLLVSVAMIAALIGLEVLPSSVFVSHTLFACTAIVFALFGDLVESLMKRVEGIKDSSNILPGHGGLLDRFDSYFAALPVCAFFF